jgi:hypothetical protein
MMTVELLFVRSTNCAVPEGAEVPTPSFPVLVNRIRSVVKGVFPPVAFSFAPFIAPKVDVPAPI